MATSSNSREPLSSELVTLDKSAIVNFASRFDPQPYHLDPDAAEQSIFGGLCASGWHVAALATKLVSDTLLTNGLPFIELTSVNHLKWTRPAFLNDQISVRIVLGESIEKSPIVGTRSQPLEVDVCNSDGAVVATMAATAAIAVDSASATAP